VGVTMSSHFKCPICEKGEYTKANPRCDNCGVDFSSFLNQHKATGVAAIDPVQALVDYLNADPLWAFYERRGGFVWLGGDPKEGPDETPFFFPRTLSPLTLKLFIQTFRGKVPGIRPKDWIGLVVEQAFVRLWMQPPRRLILDAGPLACFHPKFKKIGGPAPLRMMPVLGQPGAYYYYTGPELEARPHNGVVKQLIDSLFLESADDRRAFEQLLYWWPLRVAYPDIRSPLIIFAAKSNGVGKTTTANLLAKIFCDRIIEVKTGAVFDDRLYNRLVNTPGHTVLIDNLDNHMLPAISEALSDLVTTSTLQTYRLHQGGTARRRNSLNYIVTINNPVLTDELRSRAYVLNFDRKKGQSYGMFLSLWQSKLKEVAEHVLYQTHQHWTGGCPLATITKTSWRFPEFKAVVEKAMGRGLYVPNASLHTQALAAVRKVFAAQHQSTRRLHIGTVVTQIRQLDASTFWNLVQQTANIQEALKQAVQQSKEFKFVNDHVERS